MSNLKVCRICLCKHAKVYEYDRFHLKQYYEEVMGKKVFEKDGLPNYFCYECAAILHKFHKFKEKCWMGEKMLKELLWSGPITLSSISQIDRKENNLQSTIDIISITKRVRTCLVKHKITKDELAENKEDSDSDYSVGDKNLIEIKIEMNNEKDDCVRENEKNIVIERTPEEKINSDLEGDRMFSDGEDSITEGLNSTEKPIKEKFCKETTIEGNTIIHTEKTDTDAEIVQNEKNKKKKTKTKTGKKKTEAKTGKKKSEDSGTKDKLLDPNHWLKINLSEEEALEEFRAKAHDRKYVSAAFKCTDCHIGFSKEDMLNRHVKLRHSESVGPVACRFCNMRFKLKCDLTKHAEKHYTRYKCLRCDITCPLKASALYHNDSHNGVVRKCMHCGEEFRHPSTYYTHLRTHRSEHVCTLCGASFVSAAGLHMHKVAMHVNTVVNPEEVVNTYCERCDIKFETQKAYDEHVFHSTKHGEGHEGVVLETPAPAMPKARKQCFRRRPRKFTPCTICNKNFSTVTSYMKHHKTEHKDTPLPSKVLVMEKQICEICGASVAAGSISIHMNIHTRKKKHICPTCNMQFNSRSSMMRHQLTHSDVKPAACTLCDKRFKQVSSMKLHYRTFHLKEPYPKRNRKNKNDVMSTDEYGHEDSDDNMTLDNFYARKHRKMADN